MQSLNAENMWAKQVIVLLTTHFLTLGRLVVLLTNNGRAELTK